MNEREKIVRLWFDMWLQQKDLGIDEIFTDDVIYIESWSPKYENRISRMRWTTEALKNLTEYRLLNGHLTTKLGF